MANKLHQICLDLDMCFMIYEKSTLLLRGSAGYVKNMLKTLFFVVSKALFRWGDRSTAQLMDFSADGNFCLTVTTYEVIKSK